MKRLILPLTLVVLTTLSDAPAASGAAPADTVRSDSVATATAMQEVVVTATARQGAGTSSRIGRDAMAHLQPTTFTDLLELLPGNISKDPALDRVNAISLRETGTKTPQGASTYNPDYALASSGVLFTMDDAPIMTDASMQGVGNAAGGVRSSRNRGVDMRSLSTDEVESVEVVRGIPSAEYGNLTSGVVHVTRIRRTRPLTVRFKADGFSKLAAVGGGWQSHMDAPVLNVDAGWLDSKADPRNPRDNYRRVNASVRLSGQRSGSVTTRWNAGLAWWYAFEKDLNDPDLTAIDEYRNKEHSLTLNGTLTIRLNNSFLFNTFKLNGMVSVQIEDLERRKSVSPMRAAIAPTSMQPGVSQGTYLAGEYIADYRCEGRPVNLFLKSKAQGSVAAGSMGLVYKAGVEWIYTKNFGVGQIYDLSKPLSGAWTARPRDFSTIPGLHVLSGFAEGRLTGRIGAMLMDLQCGLRLQSLPALGSSYALSGRVITDPRINILFTIPAGQTRISLGGGWGTTSKLPTLDYLYPAAVYHDFVQLNYYCVPSPANSLVSLRTYVDDPTNYRLREAVNHKREVRMGVQWHGFSLDATYFRERIDNGFRYSTVYAPYSYTTYDITAADPSSRPDLSLLPHTDKQVLDARSLVTNGSRMARQGVEFTLTTPRWTPLATRLSVSGAWFQTVYSGAEAEWLTATDVVGNTPVSDLYAGLYDDADGQRNSQCATTFMFDTQLSHLGIIVTTTVQSVWYASTTRLKRSGIPAAYMDASGQVYPYGSEQMDDPMLRHLVLTYADDSFRTQRIPMAMYVNLKVTKTFGDRIRVALFVNRILDWLPEYKSNGLVIRRSSSAYFGMELSLSLNL